MRRPATVSSSRANRASHSADNPARVPSGSHCSGNRSLEPRSGRSKRSPTLAELAQRHRIAGVDEVTLPRRQRCNHGGLHHRPPLGLETGDAKAKHLARALANRGERFDQTLNRVHDHDRRVGVALAYLIERPARDLHRFHRRHAKAGGRHEQRIEQAIAARRPRSERARRRAVRHRARPFLLNLTLRQVLRS